jgi:hypothetical protein
MTESQSKEIVTNMEKLGKIEEQKVVNQRIIATKIIDYFKDCDTETAYNQRGMVQALESFSVVMGKALSHFGQGFGHPRPYPRPYPRRHHPYSRYHRRAPTPYPDREMAFRNSPSTSPLRAPRVGSPFGVDMDIGLTPSPIPSPERPPHDYSEQELGGREARDDEDAICSDSGGYYEVNMNVNNEDLREEDITDIVVI